jgi:hypothetical protein
MMRISDTGRVWASTLSTARFVSSNRLYTVTMTEIVGLIRLLVGARNSPPYQKA